MRIAGRAGDGHGLLVATNVLTPREREVLRLLAHGYSYQQAGMLLSISLASVRTYVGRLYRKLGVHTKSEATLVAMRTGALGRWDLPAGEL
jgi:DNA-binding CsgD family transcriptional regulator